MTQPILALALFVALAAPAAAQGQTKLRFTLDWVPQGPQAVFVRAVESGCLGREGLDVTVDRGYGSGDAVTKVANGAYDMGWADLNVMMEYNAKNADHRAIAVFITHDASSASVLALKSSGIAAPADLAGRKLASPPGDASRRLFPIFAKAAGLDASTIAWQNVSPELREPMLVQRQVDGISGLTYTSILNLQALKVPNAEIVKLKYSDFSGDLYGHTVIANPAFAGTNPKAVRSVIRCTAEMMREALQSTKPAIDALKKRDGLINEAVESERLRLSIECCWVTSNTKANGFSAIDGARLQRSIAAVADAFEIPTLRSDHVYSAAYLPSRDELGLGM